MTIQTTTRNAGLSDLVELLKDHQARQMDVVAPASALFSDGANLTIKGTEPIISETGVSQGDGTYRPTAVADEGLAEKLGVPVPYLRKLRAERPDLYDMNVNGWLYGDGESGPDPRKFLVRCFRSDDGGTGVARAFLSDSYKPIDHLDGLLATLDGIRSAGVNAQVWSADLTERRMVVRVVCEEVKAYARTLLRGYRSPFTGASGDDNPTVFAGFRITNSETGGGAYQIVPELRVEVCKNGMTISKDALREVHLGAKLSEGVIRWSDATKQKSLELVRAQTSDAVRTFLDVDYVTRTIERLEQRSQETVETPEQVEQVVRAAGYNKTTADEILAHFIKGGQANRAGVVNALTSYAQTVEDGDKAYELESRATRILVG